MSDIAIRVENLGKAYRIASSAGGKRYKTLQEDLLGFLKNPLRRGEKAETFWALKDVSFEVKHGEVLGIIGRNGAGKSTLLKILSRITRPTTGHADVYGRVGSLLEVGTGFHPELTGRENIYLNGAILGMSRAEIARRFDEIVAFAEVEQFLDTPAKRYSSGMYMRLAFAVAAHLDPEVLIVDEVLAVGDAEFQKKCLGKMSEVASSGRTVLFVSHNMAAVQSLCPQTLWLQKGQLVKIGITKNVIENYIKTDSADSVWHNDHEEPVIKNPYFLPTQISVVDVTQKTIQREISANENFGLLIEGIVEQLHRALTIGFAIYSDTDQLLFWTLQTDVREEDWPKLQLGKNQLIVWLHNHLLNEGTYRAELIISLHYTEWISQPLVNAPTVEFKIQGELSESPYWRIARPGLLAPILPFTSLLQD